MKFVKTNSGAHGKMPTAASGLGLNCLPMFNKKDTMLIWVNILSVFSIFDRTYKKIIFQIYVLI